MKTKKEWANFIKSFDSKIVKYQNRFYKCNLPDWNVHDLWLWPAYARKPHETIDSDNADRAGRSVIRIDDREPTGQDILSKITIIH